jgi:hypothetical protein
MATATKRSRKASVKAPAPEPARFTRDEIRRGVALAERLSRTNEYREPGEEWPEIKLTWGPATRSCGPGEEAGDCYAVSVDVPAEVCLFSIRGDTHEALGAKLAARLDEVADYLEDFTRKLRVQAECFLPLVVKSGRKAKASVARKGGRRQ